jgi:tetratricopeptide (TPR) repeat protein
LVNKEYNRLDWFVAHTKADLLLADLLRRHGELDKSQDLHTKILKRVQGRRQVAFHDSREVAQLEATATQQLAEVAIDRRELPRAAQLLRETLTLKEQLLRAKRRPAVFFTAFFSDDRKLKLDGDYEPGPFCSHGETQLRLAQVLKSLGRPYEVEQLLGEAMVAGTIVATENANGLRFMLHFGSVYDAAADLLSQDRPQEADTLRLSADYIWRATAAYFPNAMNQPELPPAVRERLKAHSDSPAGQLRHPSLGLYRNLDDMRSKKELPKTSFDRHAYGLAYYHAENWTKAISLFEESARLREAGHAYDWLFLAMANHQLGDHNKAQEWFDKANGSIQSTNNANAELIELREQAQRLLRVSAPEKQS